VTSVICQALSGGNTWRCGCGGEDAGSHGGLFRVCEPGVSRDAAWPDVDARRRRQRRQRWGLWPLTLCQHTRSPVHTRRILLPGKQSRQNAVWVWYRTYGIECCSTNRNCPFRNSHQATPRRFRPAYDSRVLPVVINPSDTVFTYLSVLYFESNDQIPTVNPPFRPLEGAQLKRLS